MTTINYMLYILLLVVRENIITQALQ